MRTNLRKIGSEMEDIAARYLSERGVLILERNYRSREAEIDIIGFRENVLLFIEVKARGRGKKSGAGEEAVGAAKQRRICRCADFYMHEKGIDPYRTGIRFDVVAIEAQEDALEMNGGDSQAEELKIEEENSGTRIRWIQNAFSYISYSRTRPHWRVW